MTIILRNKQIDVTMIKKLEEQRRIFRNSKVVKKYGLQNQILVYEIKIKTEEGWYVSTCCNNFNDVFDCFSKLGAIASNEVEIIVHDNYFLEKFIKPLDK